MLATTVALLLLAPASPDGAGCARTLAGTDFSGHDLAPPCGVAADTAAACCAQCGARSGCRAWTFISPRQCCLKTSDAGRRAVPGHVSGCIGNCSAPPAPPHPTPPQPPPPPPPPVQWGTPLLPGWPATYNMSLSTMIEPCDYDRMFDTRFAARFGMVDFVRCPTTHPAARIANHSRVPTVATVARWLLARCDGRRERWARACCRL